MEDNSQPSLDSWNDFAGDYIKPQFIDSFPVKFPVVNINGRNEDGSNRLFLDIEYNGRKWIFDLNKTNQTFIQNSGIRKPKDLIGKIVVVDKTKNRNPKTGQMVDGLIIIGIEDGKN